MNSKPVLSQPPPTPCYIPLCRGLLLHTFVANGWCRYALQKNLVAKVLVANQEILLQTYVAERPPKPVTNPMFLIHSQLSSLGQVVPVYMKDVPQDSCHTKNLILNAQRNFSSNPGCHFQLRESLFLSSAANGFGRFSLVGTPQFWDVAAYRHQKKTVIRCTQLK